MKLMRCTAVAALAGLVLSGCAGSVGGGGGAGGGTTLTFEANATQGGKNASFVDWLENWVTPKFQERMKARGQDVNLRFVASGVEDEQYKTKISLDLKSGRGSDIIAIDGIWVGEFAQAGYIKPLDQQLGAQVNQWEGWKHIPQSVQGGMSFEGKRYGTPLGTDGRVIFFNKELFAKAGLPADWQPKTWDEIIAAGEKLKQLEGVTPIQLNAGTSAGEATTMQGVLPMLVGTGHEVFENGKWQGNSQAVRDVLDFYKRIFDGGLGDAKLQQQPQGRDESFQRFAKGEIGILFEGDYLWRSVINPQGGIAPMRNRDSAVGWALIPAKQPGSGVRGQDYVSMSGGTGFVVNPNSRHSKLALELLQVMGSVDGGKASSQFGAAGITPRTDVNAQVLARDPLMNFIGQKVLPITIYRPGLAAYPQVSVALQKATGDIVAGRSVEEAAGRYQGELEKAVGGSANTVTD
jgi:multiple sugar transport system substrate-binding protein